MISVKCRLSAITLPLASKFSEPLIFFPRYWRQIICVQGTREALDFQRVVIGQSHHGVFGDQVFLGYLTSGAL